MSDKELKHFFYFPYSFTNAPPTWLWLNKQKHAILSPFCCLALVGNTKCSQLALHIILPTGWKASSSSDSTALSKLERFYSFGGHVIVKATGPYRRSEGELVGFIWQSPTHSRVTCVGKSYSVWDFKKLVDRLFVWRQEILFSHM